MSEDEPKEKGFSVSDRRVGVDSPAGEAGPPSGTRPEAAPTAPAGPAPASPPVEPRPLPEITFPTFLLSLSTSALMHLGVIPNPVSGQLEKDLLMAKQTIDLLNLIRQKTSGNLTVEETQMLESILYDLRMNYVEAHK